MSVAFSRIFVCWLVMVLCVSAAVAAPPSVLTLSKETEVPVRSYPAQGDTLLLWFVCDEGHGAHEARTAKALAAHGYETWFPDMLEAHFLPILPSSLEQLPPEEIKELIAHAVRLTGKKVVLVTAGHGAIPILRGAKAWQDQALPQDQPLLASAILFYPDLYSVVPAPGVEAQYHAIVAQTRLPLFIYQGQLSPGRWWLEHLKVEFARGGTKVKSKVLPQVRSHFFVRQDATPEENAMAERLPELLQEALKQLESSNQPEKKP